MLPRTTLSLKLYPPTEFSFLIWKRAMIRSYKTESEWNVHESFTTIKQDTCTTSRKKKNVKVVFSYKITHMVLSETKCTEMHHFRRYMYSFRIFIHELKQRTWKPFINFFFSMPDFYTANPSTQDVMKTLLQLYCKKAR